MSWQQKWNRIDAYYWERECHRYTIDVFPVAGSVTGERFTAWRRATKKDQMATHLGCRDTFREAVALASADLRRNRRHIPRERRVAA